MFHFRWILGLCLWGPQFFFFYSVWTAVSPESCLACFSYQTKNLHRFDFSLFLFSTSLLWLLILFAFLNIWNIVIIKWLYCLCLLIALSLSFLSWFELIFFLPHHGSCFLISLHIWCWQCDFYLVYGYFVLFYLFLNLVPRYS